MTSPLPSSHEEEVVQNTPLENPTTPQDNPQRPGSQDPNSPKTLTLEIPQNHPDQDVPEEISPFSPTVLSHRRPAGAKRKKMGHKKRALQEKKTKEKLKIIWEKLNPIPFVPGKSLDFSSHEALLRRLGLWDFVHLEFDSTVRRDLVAELIAGFNAASRCSYVGQARVRVSRPDLGRALKLPVKRDKVNVGDGVEEVKESEEDIAFVEELVSNWVLLHDDMWMMPVEVLNWMKLIKEGSLERVDWAGMIWFMVEKELLAGPELGNCYYVSHLQCLIKHQRENVLRTEVVKEEVEVKEDEEEEHVRMCEEVHMVSEMEEQKIELSLGGTENAGKDDDDGGKGEKEVVDADNDVDFEENKVEEGEEQMVKRSMDGHFLGRCDLGDDQGLSLEVERKEEEDVMMEEGRDEEEEDGMMEEGRDGEEEDGMVEEQRDAEEDDEEEDQGVEMEEEEVGFGMLPKVQNFEGFGSENLLDAMEKAHLPFTSVVQMNDSVSSGEFLVSRVEAQRMTGGSLLFDNGNGKREIEQIENELPHHSVNGANKRMRSDGAWDRELPPDFDMYMEQMHNLMGKCKMIYDAKDRAYQEMSMNQQLYLGELQRRENSIEQLKRARIEDQQKRQEEVFRLERELYMMANLLEGYKKALRETHKAFAEYRAKCSLPEEPIYVDTGSGGLVLSKMELEKQRLRKEEEEKHTRMLIEKKVKAFEAGCIAKFEAYGEAVGVLSEKLAKLEKECECLKESVDRKMTSDVPELTSTEVEAPTTIV